MNIKTHYKTKKIITLFMIFIFFLSFVGENLTYASDANICFEPILADPIVGELTIFATNDGGSSSSNTSGHAFLMFQNTSTSSIKIGGISVAHNRTITFGTWGNKSQHTGIWYNLEAYFVHKSGSYSNRVSLTTSIVKSKISVLNKLLDDNDEWELLNNCSSFAVKVWNAMSNKTLSAGTPNTPTSLMSSIKKVSGYSTGKAIPASVPIGYMNNGSFTSVTTSALTATASISLDVGDMYDGVIFTEEINQNPYSMEVEE